MRSRISLKLDGSSSQASLRRLQQATIMSDLGGVNPLFKVPSGPPHPLPPPFMLCCAASFQCIP